MAHRRALRALLAAVVGLGLAVPAGAAVTTSTAVAATVPADAEVVLTPGVWGSVTTQGRRQRAAYTIYVPAGQRVTVDVWSSQMPTSFQVVDPTGRVVDPDIYVCNNDEVRDYPASPTAGTWRIIATSPLARPFSSRAVVHLPFDLANSVNDGATRTTRLTGVGDRASYQVYGTAGERATFAVQASSWSAPRYYGAPDVHVSLVSFTGTRVELGATRETTPFKVRFLDAVIPETGYYRLVLDPDWDLTGSITWTWLRVRDRVRDVSPGTVTARTVTPGQTFGLRLAATAGQDLTVTLGRTSYRSPGKAPNGGKGTIYLVAPDGTSSYLTSWWHRASDGPPRTVTLPVTATGTWTVVVDPDEDKYGVATLETSLS